MAKPNKAVVVFSGGQDSTTCLFWAKKKYDEVIALSFNYGQRHSKELECAKKICKEHGVEPVSYTHLNGTTGIGGGIAIPHSKNKAVTKAGLASMTVPDGVDYEAMDGEPSDVFFMIAAPAEGSDEMCIRDRLHITCVMP